MMKSQSQRSLVSVLVALCGVAPIGCSTVGSAAVDLGLGSAGGVAGYHVTEGKIGGAAVGAALGYIGSRVARTEVQRNLTEAEKRGYDHAMNQAVKQQYWLIQARQRERAVDESDPRLVPVVIPETKINGVIQAAHVEFLRTER